MLAIFLIVTLAAVGVYLVTVSTGQGQAVAQDVQGARAYQAARAGMEWGTYRRLINSSCVPSTVLTFTNPGLSGFYAKVDCTEVGNEIEGAGPAAVHVYRITATGCNANPCSPGVPGQTYVERQLQITVTHDF
jgi:MSHA biogenesis protein MshP